MHGRQQLSLFNAHYDTRCFLPVHVYHVESGKPVAVLLRPGKTPSGAEIRTLLKHLVRRIRRHWPRTRLTFRGDSHYGRAEAMAWCEDNGVDYIFGLAGNSVLHGLAYEVADDLKVCRAEAGADRMRGFAAFPYAARSWSRKRRVVARLEATARGFDARYIVTSLGGEPRHLYEAVYCARGQAENLIKLHKGQLASDRTSCQSPLANQFRLVLHTAAYWLMLALRDACPAGCRSPGPSSRPSGRACSRSAPASSKRPPASASTSLRPVPTPPCSACWPGASRPRDPDRRGAVPREPEPIQPPNPDTANLKSRHRCAPNAIPRPHKINR